MSIEIPLIQEIQKFPCLYDFNVPEYNRKDVLDPAWAEVAENCNLTVPECKDKWKNIRSSFVRSLRPSGGKWKKPYYLSSYLKFIIPFLKPIGIIEISGEDQQIENEVDSNDNGNADDVEVPIASIKVESMTDFENDDLDFEEALVQDDEYEMISNQTMSKGKRHIRDVKQTESPKHKKRKTNNTNSVSEKETAMRYFLLSLLPDFASMNEDQLRMFKMKTILLIDDIKTDFEKLKNPNPISSVSSNKDNERLQKRLVNLLLKNLKGQK